MDKNSIHNQVRGQAGMDITGGLRPGGMSMQTLALQKKRRTKVIQAQAK